MTQINYEEAMAELEQIVGQMEDGELNLDELTTKLKRAQQLIKTCNDRLTKTDAEIQKILQAKK
ncbi:MAG: exodeoxyribonuclease VII small subunit [Prevotella sp.]|jgi:exodeoxyribonuclease VII small subunit|nr:exodeoxyribonuclease VII small subunit [Prevotella sp.]